MDKLDLEPKYSSNEVPGKCLKCLAEKELNICLVGLLSDRTHDVELQQRYEALLALLQSPDFESLRSKAEKMLSEGRQVMVQISFVNGKLTSKLVTR